ncbi:hypothetical protein KSS87_001380, partial [Heliosperma pusillum]
MSHIQSIVSSHYPSKPTTYCQYFPVYHHLRLKFSATKRAVTLPVVQVASSSSSGNSTPSIKKGDESEELISGTEVVRKFYEGINRHDLGSVENLIAQHCIYEDLIFPRPFCGRKSSILKSGYLQSILDFFAKFTGYVSTDLQFVIDAISEEDSSAVGVTWHL